MEPVEETAKSDDPGHAEGSAEPAALETSRAVSLGGTGPLTITARLGLSGYRLTVRGQAGMKRSKELAHIAGLRDASALDGLAGDPVSVDLEAGGPWLPAPIAPFANHPSAVVPGGEGEG